MTPPLPPQSAVGANPYECEKCGSLKQTCLIGQFLLLLPDWPARTLGSGLCDTSPSVVDAAFSQRSLSNPNIDCPPAPVRTLERQYRILSSKRSRNALCSLSYNWQLLSDIGSILFKDDPPSGRFGLVKMEHKDGPYCAFKCWLTASRLLRNGRKGGIDSVQHVESLHYLTQIGEMELIPEASCCSLASNLETLSAVSAC